MTPHPVTLKCWTLLFALVGTTTTSHAIEEEPKPKSDRELIQGTWEVVSLTEAGRKVSADGVRIVIVGDTLTLRPSGATDAKDMISMKFRLDPSKRPKAIDTRHEIDSGKPILQLGVYSITEDKLQLCLVGAGQARPVKVGSKTGHGLVLKRVKTGSK